MDRLEFSLIGSSPFVGVNFLSLDSLVASQFLLHRSINQRLQSLSVFLEQSILWVRSSFGIPRSFASSLASSRVIDSPIPSRIGTIRCFIDRQIRYDHCHSARARVLAYATH